MSDTLHELSMCKRQSPQETLLKESGKYTTNNMFISFFYSLLQDYVHPGDFQKALENSSTKDEEHVLYNGYLAQYAEFVYRQLKK